MKCIVNILNKLDEIAKSHEEIFDTDVRENLHIALENVINNELDSVKLINFGMFDDDVDRLIRKAFAELSDEIKSEKVILSLSELEKLSIKSDAGTRFDEYFGSMNSSIIAKKKWYQFWK